jgi:hypothetical protein
MNLCFRLWFFRLFFHAPSGQELKRRLGQGYSYAWNNFGEHWGLTLFLVGRTLSSDGMIWCQQIERQSQITCFIKWLINCC